MKEEQEINDDKTSVSPDSPNKSQINKDQDKKRIKKKKIHQYLIANLIDTQYSVVKTVVHKMGMKVVRDASSDDWDLYWTDNAVTSQFLAKMKPHQKINHFPGMYTLSRKNYLARNLIKMEKKFPNDYNFFPKTWVLPTQLNQFRTFMENDTSLVVIAKPQASSQGKGIFLSKSIDDFQFGQHYVVQKYLKKPFLIDGLKFDLRVYVLVAGCDPLRVYVYKEGLARFATQPYCTPRKQNLGNLFMHLTNYAINKNSKNFEPNISKEDMGKGHKRSLTSILMKIQELGHSKQKVWQNIKDCIVKTIISAQPMLAHQYKSSQPNNYLNNMCFEILGFDIILNSNLKAEVLQVNYTPSFTTDSPLDLQIKKNLIEESLILMNLTFKSKHDIINEKKKQMKERTLTGKNFYHSRQARQIFINRAQRIRNYWENKHLGNFQRAYPIISYKPTKLETQQNTSKLIQEQELDEILNLKKIVEPFEQSKDIYGGNALEQEKLQQEYNTFLEYSIECYQNNTGANIRRNTKQNGSNGNAQGDKEENAYPLKKETLESEKNPLKYTNTENLERIYKSKFRPMVYKKSNTKKTKEEVNKSMNKIQALAKVDSCDFEPKEKLQTLQKQSEKIKNKTNPYLSTMQCFQIGQVVHTKHQSANNYKQKVKTTSIAKNDMSKDKGMLGSKYQQLKIHERAGSSFKKGVSTVYNITFNDKKVK